MLDKRYGYQLAINVIAGARHFNRYRQVHAGHCMLPFDFTALLVVALLNNDNELNIAARLQYDKRLDTPMSLSIWTSNKRITELVNYHI